MRNLHSKHCACSSCEDKKQAAKGLGRWLELRENVLQDPKMDKDTINWALEHIDNMIPKSPNDPPLT